LKIIIDHLNNHVSWFKVEAPEYPESPRYAISDAQKALSTSRIGTYSKKGKPDSLVAVYFEFENPTAETASLKDLSKELAEHWKSNDLETVTVSLVHPNADWITKFTLVQTKSQIAVLRMLQKLDWLKVYAIPSSSVTCVTDVVDFYATVMDAASMENTVAKLQKKQTSEVTARDFVLRSMEKVSELLNNMGVSFHNSVSFKDGCNIKNTEVLSILAFLSRLKTKEFGIYDIVAARLLATQHLNVFDVFSGNIKSYISNGRNVDKILFSSYGGTQEKPLVNLYKADNVVKFRHDTFCIDSTKASLIIDAGFGMPVVVSLNVGGKKVDLAQYSRKKENGATIIDIVGVHINDNGLRQYTIPVKKEYVLANIKNVNALTNAETVVIEAGFLSFKLEGELLELTIPLHEHRDLFTVKSHDG